jgi:hypothetical protein
LFCSIQQHWPSPLPDSFWSFRPSSCRDLGGIPTIYRIWVCTEATLSGNSAVCSSSLPFHSFNSWPDWQCQILKSTDGIHLDDWSIRATLFDSMNTVFWGNFWRLLGWRSVRVFLGFWNPSSNINHLSSSFCWKAARIAKVILGQFFPTKGTRALVNAVMPVVLLWKP